MAGKRLIGKIVAGVAVLILALLCVFLSSCKSKSSDGVEEKKVVSLEVSVPDHDFVIGEDDFSDVVVTILYDDESTDSVILSRDLIVDADLPKLQIADKQEITIVYKGARTKIYLNMVRSDDVYYKVTVIGGYVSYVDRKEVVPPVIPKDGEAFEQSYKAGTEIVINWWNGGGKDNYNFDYWTVNEVKNPDLSSIIEVKVESDVSYHAYSSAIGKTVSFETGFNDITVKSKTTERLNESNIEEIDEEGYIFLWWTTDRINVTQARSGYNKNIVKFPYEVVKDVTFYAVWTPIGIRYEETQGGYSVAEFTGKLNSLKIPETVTVGDRSIPVVAIERDAFDTQEGRLLTDISLSSNIRSIEEGAFAPCDHLEKIEVDSNSLFFRSIDGILFVAEPDDVSVLELVAYPSAKITGVYALPDSIQIIWDKAFYNASVAGIVLNSQVKNIDSYAFYSPHIDYVDFSSVNPSGLRFGDNLFHSYIHQVKVFSGREDAFKSFSQFFGVIDKIINEFDELTEIVTFKATETDDQESISVYRVIEEPNFDLNSKTLELLFTTRSLKNYILQVTVNGYKITSIAKEAFASCDYLSSFTLPLGTKLERICDNAFDDTPWVKTLPNQIIKSNDDTVFYKYLGTSRTVYIERYVEKIAEGAFSQNKSLEYIDITDNASLKNIAAYAFYKCSAFKGFICTPNPSGEGIYLKKSVEKVGAYAFYGTAIPEVKIQEETSAAHNSWNTIGEYAFSHCDQLLRVRLAKPMNNIATTAFLDCYALQEFVLLDSNPKFVVYDGVLYEKEKSRCSELVERSISGYNGKEVIIKYDDCNPFGIIAGDFGESPGYSEVTTPNRISGSTINNISSLSELYKAFMRKFNIPMDDTSYTPSIDSTALEIYSSFYDKAIDVFSGALVSFAKQTNGNLSESAVIGVNYSYTMVFGTEISPTEIDYQQVVANLFGFSSKAEFMSYAKTLVTTYAQNIKNLENFEALYDLDGGFYTDIGVLVFPIAVKNNLSSTILAYIFVDINDMLVSVWLNDINAALWATNFNEIYYTNDTIENELYCKNSLFVPDDRLKLFMYPAGRMDKEFDPSSLLNYPTKVVVIDERNYMKNESGTEEEGDSVGKIYYNGVGYDLYMSVFGHNKSELIQGNGTDTKLYLGSRELTQTTAFDANGNPNGEKYFYFYEETWSGIITRKLVYNERKGTYCYDVSLNVSEICEYSLYDSNIAALRIPQCVKTIDENALRIPGLVYIYFESAPKQDYATLFTEYEPEFVVLPDLSSSVKNQFYGDQADLLDNKDRDVIDRVFFFGYDIEKENYDFSVLYMYDANEEGTVKTSVVRTSRSATLISIPIDVYMMNELTGKYSLVAYNDVKKNIASYAFYGGVLEKVFLKKIDAIKDNAFSMAYNMSYLDVNTDFIGSIGSNVFGSKLNNGLYIYDYNNSIDLYQRSAWGLTYFSYIDKYGISQKASEYLIRSADGAFAVIEYEKDGEIFTADIKYREISVSEIQTIEESIDKVGYFIAYWENAQGERIDIGDSNETYFIPHNQILKCYFTPKRYTVFLTTSKSIEFDDYEIISVDQSEMVRYMTTVTYNEEYLFAPTSNTDNKHVFWITEDKTILESEGIWKTDVSGSIFISLRAVFGYKLIFDCNNSNASVEKSYAYVFNGQAYTLPVPTTKDDKVFKGWELRQKDGSVVRLTNEVGESIRNWTITEENDYSVYAVWE